MYSRGPTMKLPSIDDDERDDWNNTMQENSITRTVTDPDDTQENGSRRGGGSPLSPKSNKPAAAENKDVVNPTLMKQSFVDADSEIKKAIRVELPEKGSSNS